MPINPYTSAIKYEYKPLGLEAFAAPLSKMQEQFDVTKMAVEAEDFDLSHLPYGTDPQKAKQLKELITSKRDELASNLQKTKNFREASLKLMELRKIWKEDPEIQALQSNYKKFQELDKEQKERADKGDITRDQYLEWKDRAIQEYTSKGGTSFKSTAENKEGTYNPFGRTGRLKDEAKNLEEVRFKIMNAQPEKVRDIFSQAGITMSPEEVHSIETLIKEKRYDELKSETEAYLRRYPGFTEWASEVADYNLYKIQQNPEQYNTTAKNLISSYLTDSKNYLQSQENAAKKGDKEAKKYLQSEAYTKLKDMQNELSNMISTGKYDENIVKNLYTEEHLNKVFNSGELANILSYKNVTSNHSFRRLPKDDGSGNGSNDKDLVAGFFTPNTYEKLDLSGLNKQKTKSGRTLYETLKETHKIGNGVLGMISRGKNGTSEYEYNTKHPDVMIARDKEILAAYSATIASGGNAKDFYRRIKHLGSNATEHNAKLLFNDFNTNPYSVQKLQKSLESTEYDYHNYLNAKENIESVNKSAYSNSDYKNIIDNQLAKLSPYTETASQAKLFNPYTYSQEELKKAGIKISTYKDISGTEQIRKLTLNEVARLKGYKSASDAISNGYTFENIKLKSGVNVGNISSGDLKVNVFAADAKEYKTLSQIDKQLKQQLLNKGLVKNEQSYRYVGDTNADKQILNYFLQESDLSNFQPAYSQTQQGQAGFDEQGKLLPSTVFDFNSKTMPKMIKHGNSLFLEVPIKYKNEDGETVQTTTIVKPKKGYELSFERLLNKIDVATSSAEGDALDRQTNDMVKVAKFDQRFNTNLSNSLVKAVNVKDVRDAQEIVTTIPYGADAPGVSVEIVKVSTGDGGYTLKVMLSNGVNRQYLTNPETGKDFYSNDAEAVKAFIARQMGI